MTILGKNAFDNAARCIELGQSTCRWFGNLEVTGTITSDSGGEILPNNAYLQSKNAAGTGQINLIKGDTTDNTFVNASTGKLIKFGINDVSKMTFSGTVLAPVTTGTIDLGTSALLFGNIYSTPLKIDATGHTAVNAVTGKLIEFSINDVDLMTFSGTVLAPVTASLVTLGTIALPFGTIFSAQITVDASNNTIVNAATSKVISFDINSVSLMTFSGTVLAPVTTATVVLGSSSLGFGDYHGALAKTLVLKQGSNGKTGTVTANGTTPVTVSNTSITANSGVFFTLKTVGGTVGDIRTIKTITPGTGFTVAFTAADTSVYNYHVIEAEA